MIVNIVLAVVMVFGAVVDIKKKEIPVWIFIVLGITELINGVRGERSEWYVIATGIIPGILLLALAKITEQSIGYGDGIVLAELGIATGVGKCMLILAGALALAGVFSLGMLIVKKVDKRYRIPFIPFLTATYFMMVYLQASSFRY